MNRSHNTSTSGHGFSQAVIDAVWAKATIVAGADANELRKDSCGAWIKKSKYGDTTPDGNGWEIDHIKPVSKGGSDDLSNLQPLQWQNNRQKSDTWPQQWVCLVRAS